MNILFIGDIYGHPGLEMVEKLVPKIKADFNIDVTIVNGENVSSSKGLRYKDYERLMRVGVDAITLGNHAFFQTELIDYIDKVTNIVRPINWDGVIPGVGSRLMEINGFKIRITNLMGKTYMGDMSTNPLIAMEALINSIQDEDEIHFVDMHAEATSEKIIVANSLDGIVSAFVGTHTHVPTSDYRILKGGTAFITDVGMVGPHYSSIGTNIDLVTKKAYSLLPIKFEIAEGESQFCGVVINVDEKTKRATSIKQIYIAPHRPYEMSLVDVNIKKPVKKTKTTK